VVDSYVTVVVYGHKVERLAVTHRPHGDVTRERIRVRASPDYQGEAVEQLIGHTAAQE
jgi:hypothetical protein